MSKRIAVHEEPEIQDVAQEGPTVDSIAAARAAQQREREAFTMHTGIRLDRDGQLRRPIRRDDW
jgi:hypothetical protein